MVKLFIFRGELYSFQVHIDFFLFLVDLFYMKTCPFRGAKPDLLSKNRGLFCKIDPQTRYGMTQCQLNGCLLCFPKQEIIVVRRQSTPNHPTKFYEPVVQFLPQQKHRFVSGYEAILNCPVVS